MENAVIKTIIGGGGTVLSYVTGGGIPVFLVLCIIMGVDFITGMMADWYNGIKINSKTGIKGFIKKSYILILIGIIYLLEFTAIPLVTGTSTNGHIGNGACVTYIVFELISINENGEEMGHKPSEILKRVIPMLKGDKK